MPNLVELYSLGSMFSMQGQDPNEGTRTTLKGLCDRLNFDSFQSYYAEAIIQSVVQCFRNSTFN